MDIEHHKDAHCHKQQSYGKQGIYLSDDFIDRQQCGENIIDEYDNDPEGGIEAVGSELCQQSGRTCHKDGTYQNHQDDGEAAHHLLGGQPQVAADNFG